MKTSKERLTLEQLAEMALDIIEKDNTHTSQQGPKIEALAKKHGYTGRQVMDKCHELCESPN